MQFYAVDRRIGGLEIIVDDERFVGNVDRRIGGLEKPYFIPRSYRRVDRRIGGLEIRGENRR